LNEIRNWGGMIDRMGESSKGIRTVETWEKKRVKVRPLTQSPSEDPR